MSALWSCPAQGSSATGTSRRWVGRGAPALLCTHRGICKGGTCVVSAYVVLPVGDSERAAVSAAAAEIVGWQARSAQEGASLPTPPNTCPLYLQALSEGELTSALYNIACCRSMQGDVENGLIAIAGCVEQGELPPLVVVALPPQLVVVVLLLPPLPLPLPQPAAASFNPIVPWYCRVPRLPAAALRPRPGRPARRRPL